MLIDHQAHWYPPAYLETLGGDGYPQATPTDDGGYLLRAAPDRELAMGPGHVDLEIALADMDAHGIDAMFCSPAPIGGVAGMEVADQIDTCRLVNDETARAQRDHPDRILGVAMLPLGDLDATAAELERAIGELGMKAICVVSGDPQRPLAQPGAGALLARIEQLRVPIFLHPAFSSGGAATGYPPLVDIALGWLADTSALVYDLILSGNLDAAPELQIVHPHLGGVIPYLRGRMGVLLGRTNPRRPLDEVLRTQFLVDCANNTPGAMRLAVDTYGAGRIVYATDFPWVPRIVTTMFLDAELDDTERATLHANRAGVA